MIAPLLTLLALLLPARPVHPGPPIFVEIEVEDEGTRVVVTSEQEALLAWMGEAVPVAEADSTRELTEKLAGEAVRLLQEERGLDLEVDGAAVTYQVAAVKLFDEFGVGNAEPAIQIELRLAGSAERPSSIELRWGLFDRVEDKTKRVLPVLFSAGGEFDLMRASEESPRIRWESKEARPETAKAQEPEEAKPLVAHRRPPRPGGEGRVKLWKSTQVVAYFLGALALLSAMWLRPARNRVVALVLAGACCGGAWAIGDRASPGDRLLVSEALTLFGRLHENVYSAFDGRSEDEIYDRLANSVEGPLLDELYADVLVGLVLEDDGGAICRVEEVEALDSALVGSADLTRLTLDAESYVVDW
ncbi:MAG: hypothetical protein AAF368_16680, partial [Planctomycetota bacterium]